MDEERRRELEHRLRGLLGGQRGQSVRWLGETDSTNRQLRLLADSGAAEGTVLLAEAQTMGRGRQGRSFASPAGKGLYLSILLRPKGSSETLGRLTPGAAVAVCRGIASVCGLHPEIKWVNDLICRGRKLCGILTEGTFRDGEIQYAVLGIGVNVSALPEDFPPELRSSATSILQETGLSPDRAALAAALIRELDALSGLWGGEEQAYLQAYRDACCTIGQQVRLTDGTEGLAAAIDEDYALVVRQADGTVRRVQSGEASLVKALTAGAARPTPTGE